MLLIDENLSYKLVERLQTDFPGICCVAKTPELGEGTADEIVWHYAKTNNLAILTKDRDFVEFWQRFGPPPKVVHLEIGNCRLLVTESLLRNNQATIMQFLLSSQSGLQIIK
ncbi:MAG: DUF5615 family PIN-like protein [Psychrosphaera sp.]|nr:DUF5615 family PIN-like protein [Psychrosphaera sp.]